jgi:hypothetical protein
MSKEVLGLDIGRVITSDAQEGECDIFSPYYLLSVPRPGAFGTIHDLVTERYGDEVHLISKAKNQTKQRLIEVLDYWNFYKHTGVLREHVHFCDEDIQKAPIAKGLGVTDFVDDKVGVLRHLPATMNRYLFVPPIEGLPSQVPEGIIPVIGWAGVRCTLLGETE